MKIEKIRLENYRAFKEEISFLVAPSMTVFAGINGRGKTAILDGIAYLVSCLLRDLRLVKYVRRTLGYQDIYGQVNTLDITMNATCAGEPVTLSRSKSRGKARVNPDKGIGEPMRRKILQGYGDSDRPGDQTPIAAYYTTDRSVFRATKKLPEEPRDESTAAYSGALVNRTVDYHEFIARYRLWESQGDKRPREALQKALNVFLDGFKDFQFEDDPPRITVEKNGVRLSLDQLSDGERSFIAILGDLVRRLTLANPELDDPLQGYGVVLIDELELHLHPKWQREICESLRTTFPNIQFIGTTHSPFVIQSLRPGELINLDTHPEEPEEYTSESIEDISENVMGVKVPQQSKKYLEMMEAAEKYYTLLREMPDDEEAIKAAERRLDELAMPFSDDPAFQAMLNVEREIWMKKVQS